MEEKFTIEEFRNYIKSQDSLGDVMYNLKAENVIKANLQKQDGLLGEDCAYFDCAQGRNLCTCETSRFISCDGPCEYFEPM